jgi:hypothetical protein
MYPLQAEVAGQSNATLVVDPLAVGVFCQIFRIG